MTAAVALAVVPPAEPVVPFDFSADFQSKIAALAIRDPDFMLRVAHLLKPDYFENVGEALLINLTLRYFEKYRRLPDSTTRMVLVKEDRAAKVIRDEHIPLVVEALKRIAVADLGDRDFAIEKVAEFARHQAVGTAILESVSHLEKGRFDKIETVIKRALEVAAETDGGFYDYFKEIKSRTETRLEKASGKLPPRGITTGVHLLNERLYHRGWGRKELTVVMGGAKATKSMMLVNFAKAAALGGANVLAITLEMSKDLWADRLDACISGTMMTELGIKIHDVDAKIASLEAKAGALKLHEFPSGTFRPSDLRRLLERYRSMGVLFDLIVVDYADIMAPDFRTDNAIENSKDIWLGLRAIAFEQDAAMLTATQTNRTGHTATVAKAEHVAEDFNKIRIADLVISINASDEEIARKEARLYFAASRNQESGFTMIVNQDRARMQAIVGARIE